MIYRKLGSTGMMVSRVAFGGIPILLVSEKKAVKVLRRAFEMGMNFVDTHRGYGDSEIKIGKALGRVREQYYLCTKISDHSRKGAHRSLKESLKRLQTDYIDLLLIKNLDSDKVISQAMGRNGSLRVAREAQKAGVVRHIGFTSHTEKSAYKALRTGEYEAVMFPYNILNTGAEKRIFRFCKRHNIGFICMKPLAGGLLAVPSKVFSEVVKGKANTTAAGAVRFCLSHPAVGTVIPGLASLKHLREGLRGMGVPMTPREREQAIRKAARLGTSFCRNCGYCKPCPQGIEINDIFRFYHYYTSYDLKAYAQAHYRKLKVKAAACVDCGVCVPRCPYRIPIPRKLKMAHRILAIGIDWGRV